MTHVTNNMKERRQMIIAKVQNGKLIIEADLDGKSVSKTGKSIMLATTAGFQSINDVKYSLNVIKGK